ncbi:amidase signature enzyme [Lecanosticta acicola]|uniref:Amidase signature enzyme n=1 Tax=Lecanosticta acicola TaxID=111012 RepID=A0AAI8W0W6_9PEZI|nr:amidase signature enzyme [Lecanosticta acicola]
MSIVSLATGEPTCTLEDLRAICHASNFSIKPGTLNETAFLLFANSFDAVCQSIQDLPEYEDPRLAPTAVQEGERTYYRPDPTENPLNGWAHRTTLTSADPESKSGLLAGRTVAFKDNVSVAGLPHGLGCSPKHFKDGKHPISTIDATVVKRIFDAGGIVKGTATCENFSAFALSFTSDSGVVHNAWLPGYATGGSSSGCGTLVSVGDVEEARKNGKDSRDYPLGEGADLAVGGDQGGSIRLPASYSGIYGLKPTHGLIPYTGIASLNPMMDHTGPMARTVEDTALLLQVMAGYDGIDPRMTPESPTFDQVENYLDNLNEWISQKQQHGEWILAAAAKGLRIGILKEAFEVPGLDPSVRDTVRAAADRFKSLGAEVHEISIPLHKLGAAIWTIATRPQMPHFVANKPGDMLGHPLPHLDPLPIDQDFFDILSNRNPAVVNVLMNAAHLEHKYGPSLIRKAHMHVHQLKAAYDEAFERVDVLLTPINPTVGPPHPKGTLKTEGNPNGLSERIMDLFEPAIGNTLNTCSFNVTGHPAMSMPVGWGEVKGGEGRLPIGMQVVAKRWDEGSIFKAAKAWEVGGSWKDS